MFEMPVSRSEFKRDMQIQLDPPVENFPIRLFVLRPNDVTPDYVSWLNDPSVNQYLECRFATHTIESTRKYVESILTSPLYLFLGIRSGLSGNHVGNIKLGPIDRHHWTGEVGILIGNKSVWGQGIARSAINMMAEIARAQLSLRKLTAGC